MLHINERIQIPFKEFRWSFVRSGGPGGQNVNKVASKATLRWNLTANTSLPVDVKERLRAQQLKQSRGRLEPFDALRVLAAQQRSGTTCSIG